MSFKFVKVMRSLRVGTNPGTRYWARMFRSQTIEPDLFVKRVSLNTQVSETVVFAVLKAVEMQLAQSLEDGAAVKLPFVGMFIPTFDATAKTTLAQVDASTISNYRYRFFPSKYLKNVAKATPIKEAAVDITGLQAVLPPGLGDSKALTEEQFQQLQSLNSQDSDLPQDIDNLQE